MKRFLLINPFGIGDVLFTTPIIRAIKDNIPDSFIGYWCNERVAPILRNHPDINKVFALSRGDIKKIYQKSRIKGMFKSLSLFFGLKKAGFDTVIDFSLDHRYALTAKLAGIKKRVGFDYKLRGKILTDKIYIEGYNIKHVVEYYLDLLKLIHLRPKSSNLELFVPENDKEESRNLLNAYGISAKDLTIGIAPGGGLSWGQDAKYKHWPAERFAVLADKLIEDFKAKILILGSGEEKGLADAMVKKMRNRAVNLSGKTDLTGLAAMINNLDMLISNDGGPIHMAVALGVSTVSIFGPVDQRIYGQYPLSDNHAIVYRYVSCRPCYKNFRFMGCLNSLKCTEEITVDEVYAAVKRLIK